VQPNDDVGGGAIFYNFRLDQPQAVGPGVANKDVANEVDLYTDVALNKNFALSLVAAFANPGAAVKQATGRTSSFTYGMVFFGYNF